jgi:hypothetical protein
VKSKSSSPKQKFPLDKNKVNVMLEVFFDIQGLFHYEFISEGRAVKKDM